MKIETTRTNVLVHRVEIQEEKLVDIATQYIEKLHNVKLGKPESYYLDCSGNLTIVWRIFEEDEK